LEKRNIPSRLSIIPSSKVNPPVETRVQTLPFKELTWQDFEKLCYRLAKIEGDVEHCQQYGNQGDTQHGIDIYSRISRSDKYRVYQCKNESNFGPAKIESTVTIFLNGNWAIKTKEFILCTRESLRSTIRADEIEVQAKRLEDREIRFSILDTEQLSTLLKSLPELVDDFFGRKWVECFCGVETALSLEGRLDGNQIVDLKTNLLLLYKKVFNIHDRGIPLPNAGLPLEERFVLPNIVESQIIIGKEKPNEIDSSKSKDERDRNIQKNNLNQKINSKTPFPNWLIRNKKNLLFGEPGSGKSSLLRYLALDLLKEEPRLEVVTQRWGDHIPILLPFGLWTKLINDNSNADKSIKGVFKAWLRSWNSENLIPLIEIALSEKRILLLIDGLDEFTNEDSAKIALNYLEAFLELNDTIVIATTRPTGFQRLAMKTDGWQQAEISDLSLQQQKDLVSIWFQCNIKQLNIEIENHDLKVEVEKQVDLFFTELRTANELSELAKNPLLLCLLISFQISNVSLPSGRFEAYGILTDHLLSVHPQIRRVASETPKTLELKDSDIKKSLAYVAYYIHIHHSEGIITETMVVQVLIDFLQNTEQGFGMEESPSYSIALKILSLAESNLAIIVRRSETEISFYHRTIQEYLTAFHISRLPLPDQINLIEEYSTKPHWKEVTLILFQIIQRPDDIKLLVDIIKSKYKLMHKASKIIIQDLLAEIAFSNPNCPPQLSKDLAKEIFWEIEMGTLISQREKLINHVITGLRSPVLSSEIKGKILKWFPNRVGYSQASIFNSMSTWLKSDELINALILGINAEDYDVKNAAAQTLSKIGDNDSQVCEILFNTVNLSTDLNSIAVAMDGLTLNWTNDSRYLEVVERLSSSKVPILELVAIKGKLKLNMQNERDLNTLLKLGKWESGLLKNDDIAISLLKGWPGSDKIKKLCFKSLERFPGEKLLQRDIALKILLSGYPMDEEVAQYCVKELKNEQYPFISLSSYDAFPNIAKNFRDNPLIVNALDEWVERVEYREVEIAQASLTGRTEIFKNRLLEHLQKSFPHWAAGALLEGWGMSDEQVANTLISCVKKDASYSSNFAHLIPQIIADPLEAKKLLINILNDPDCYRYDFVIDGISKLGDTQNDSDVVTDLLNILRLKGDSYLGGIKNGLFVHYNLDSRVRELAIKDFESRDVNYPSLAYGYGNDPLIRSKILQILNPLPTSLRQIIAENLSHRDVDEQFALDLLNLYDYEVDKQIKVQASIGYHSKLKNSGLDQSIALQRLSETIVCYGHDHQERRLSAFSGLLVLDRLDIMVSKKEQDGRESAINSVEGFNLNFPHLKNIFKNWTKLRDFFKDNFATRLFRYDSDSYYIWDHLATVADLYDIPKAEVLNHYSSRKQKVSSEKGLKFLGRTVPGSNLLLEYCFNVLGLNEITITDTNLQTSYRDMIVAAELIGENFWGDEKVFNMIDFNKNKWKVNELILVLSEAWPDCEELESYYSEMGNSKRKYWNSTIIRFYCQKASSIYMFNEIKKIIKQSTYLPKAELYESFLKPILRRLQKDDILHTILIKYLNSYPSSSEKVSISKLIYLSKGLTPDLSKWSEKELEKQFSGIGIEGGLDISTGEIVSVPDSISHILNEY
jgi:archaellum biogenesis ATPase FlaH